MVVTNIQILSDAESAMNEQSEPVSQFDVELDVLQNGRSFVYCIFQQSFEQ